ncbi:MAG: phasin family protein [Solirubrobacterales bacterium]
MSVLRKMFLFGVGAVDFTIENAEKMFNELVDRGESSTSQAKKAVDETMKKAETETQELKDSITREIDNLRQKAGLVTRSELDALKAKLEQLENQLNKPADDANKQ